MDIFSKIFSFIGDLFSKIFNAIKKILPYILLAVAAFYSMGGSFAFLTELGIGPGITTALYAAGTSFLFAPEETAAVVGTAVSALGNVASKVVTAATGVLGTGITALGSTLLLPIALGLGAYWLFTRKKDEDPDAKEKPTAPPEPLKSSGDVVAFPRKVNNG